MSAHSSECFSCFAQHSQHPDRPRRTHRCLGLGAFPGEVLPSGRAQLLQIKVLVLQGQNLLVGDEDATDDKALTLTL